MSQQRSTHPPLRARLHDGTYHPFRHVAVNSIVHCKEIAES
jgi:hypothetical protein